MSTLKKRVREKKEGIRKLVASLGHKDAENSARRQQLGIRNWRDGWNKGWGKYGKK